MASRRFQARTTLAECEAREVFEWIADYHNVPLVLEGVTRWEPKSRRTQGVGARFFAEMRTLGIPLTSEMELVDWQPPHRIGWHSRGGLIEQEGSWEIIQAGAEVDVVLTIEYVPPAAALGNLLAGPVEGMAQRRLQKALDRMHEHICV